MPTHMQTQRKRSHTNTQLGERGVSLLIVVLVGSIMVLTAVSIALVSKRALQSSQSYQESLQDAYTTEDAFACVRQWLTRDENAFDDGATVVCGDDAITQNTTIFSNATNYRSGGGYSTSTFTVYAPSGNVEVEVVRDLAYSSRFKGLIYARGYNVGETSPRAAERLRVYKYESEGFDFSGVDVMFVIDRSGSIDDSFGGADVRPPLGSEVTGTEWEQLLLAVATSTRSILDKFPNPRVGYVSFGKTTSDVGAVVTQAQCVAANVDTAPACTTPGTCCSSPDFNWRKAEVGLKEKSDIGELLTHTVDTPDDYTDDRPKITTSVSDTNLSLGLAVAGAELMGRYYPDTKGNLSLFMGSTLESGYLEDRVSGNYSLVGLPLQPEIPYTDPVTGNSILIRGQDRPDNLYPDYIVIITDGAPNATIRHTTNPVDCVEVPGGTVSETNKKGDTLLFQTPQGTGCVNTVNDAATTPPVTGYYYCNDLSTQPTPVSEYPADPVEGSIADPSGDGWGFDTNTFGADDEVYPAMCNATKIAYALKDASMNGNNIIKIAAIGVGVTDETRSWLKNMIVSEVDGEKLYVDANTFDDVPTLFNVLAEKIAPSLFR